MLKFCTENQNMGKLGSDKNYVAYFPVYFQTAVQKKKKLFKELYKKIIYNIFIVISYSANCLKRLGTKTNLKCPLR